MTPEETDAGNNTDYLLAYDNGYRVCRNSFNESIFLEDSIDSILVLLTDEGLHRYSPPLLVVQLL